MPRASGCDVTGLASPKAGHDDLVAHATSALAMASVESTPLDHERLQESAHRHLLLHFSRNGAYGPGRAPLLVLERGEGPYVFDTAGRRYIDGLSSLFCAQLGYSY